MFRNPFLLFDGEPEEVNTKSYKAQKHPFYPMAEKASGGAFEHETTSVDNLIFIKPSVLSADSARRAESQRKDDEERV